MHTDRPQFGLRDDKPVSSASSRIAAAVSDSPGSARPLGMSQRGERVAWPSRMRVCRR